MDYQINGRRKPLLRHSLKCVAFSVVMLLLPAHSVAEEVCVNLWRDGGVGPWDYNDPSRDFQAVERRHFTNNVYTLTRGESSHLGADIQYTLNVIPNHPRALDAMSRLAQREGRDPPRHSRLTVGCWFHRAMEFRPEDVNVRLAYAVHLNRVGRRGAAIETLRQAIDMAPSNAALHYNLGLMLLDNQEFEQARAHAERAYMFGSPLPGLRERLARAGYPLSKGRSAEVEQQIARAMEYFQRQDYGQATTVLQEVLTEVPNDAEVHYNLGVFLMRQGKHHDAQEHAQKAYDLGFPHPGLRNALERAGYPIVEN